MEATGSALAALRRPRGVAGETLLARAGDDPARLLAVALRSRSEVALDVLVRLAGPRLTAGSAPYRLALATALAGMSRSPGELELAVDLYAEVLDTLGPRALPAADQRHLAQAAFLAGRHELVEGALARLDRLTPAVVAGLRADLANPSVGGPGARAHEEWVEVFGRRFVERGLEPPRVAPGGACLFDGLRLGAGRSVDGPLVSVVVPAYRPDEGLLTSVRSVLAQSHGNLEVLLVDDASGEAFDELFSRAQALDPRVRLLRQARNGGSYLARNTALAQARGELVTTQDADDWSHPERLAAQLALMAEHPSAVASRSAAIRCRPDLTRQWFGYSPERMNASALMVRRDVLEQVGGFDALRKGADSELHERLRLLGEGAVVDVAAPLAVTRLAPGSLSRADFSLGRHSPDRVLFRSAFRHWHASLTGAAAPADLRAARAGAHPYAAPRSFVRGLTGGQGSPGEGRPRTAYPVVAVVDLAAPLPDLDGLLGRPVPAVLGREDLTRAGAQPPSWHPTLLDAAREGRLELLTDTDEVQAESVVVLDPALLAPGVEPLPALRAARALVAVPWAGPGEPPRDLETAGRAVRDWLGVEPVWVARDGQEQRAWAAEGWALPLLSETGKSLPR